MNQNLTRIVAASVLLTGIATATVSTLAQSQAPDPPAPPRQAGHGGMNFDMLTEALKNTPGCLGVEVAQFQSGKLSIIAWFENKAAAVRWYNHPMHRGAREMFFPENSGPPEGYVPLAHLEDETKPLMVIATITPNRQQQEGGSPISQISIELYQPAPGGLAIGGRLTPSGVDVPHMSMSGGF